MRGTASPVTLARVAVVVVALVLVAVGCGGEGSGSGSGSGEAGSGEEEGGDGPADRPPLGSPPDPGPIPADDGLDAALRARVVASTVRVFGLSCGTMSTGSGFAITENLVATNAHVIVGIQSISVRTLDERELAAVPVAYDPVSDLAILEVDGLGLDPLELGGAQDHTIGALIGWDDEPDPTPYRIDRPVIVRIDAVGGDERVERRSWLVAADIEKGDSGAALVDHEGIVVGIAYATSTKGLDSGYAVRASELEDLIAAGLDPNLTIPGC